MPLRAKSVSVYSPVTRQRWNPLDGAADQSDGAADQSDYLRYLSALLEKVIGLRPDTGSAFRAKLLSFCSDNSNLPAFSELPIILRKLAATESRAGLNTAALGIEDLAACMGRWADVRHGSWPFNHRLNVLPLKDLPPRFEYFFVSLLFKHLTDRATQQGHSTDLSHAVFFDEALSYLGKDNGGSDSARASQVAAMLRLARSYGILFWAGVQQYALVHDSVRDNTPVFLTFRANSAEEARIACDRLLIDRSRSHEIMSLKPGEAFIITPEIQRGIQITVSHIDLGDYPSEAEIAKKMAPVWAKWDAQTIFAPPHNKEKVTIDFRELLGEKPTAPSLPEDSLEPVSTEVDQVAQPSVQAPTDPAILSEYFALLRSCKNHPEYGVSEHYQCLGFSSGKGNRTKNELIARKWIKSTRVTSPRGGRPREVLSLLAAGLEVINESE